MNEPTLSDQLVVDREKSTGLGVSIETQHNAGIFLYQFVPELARENTRLRWRSIVVGTSQYVASYADSKYAFRI